MERTEYICVRQAHKKMTMKNAKEQEKYEAEMLAGIAMYAYELKLV